MHPYFRSVLLAEILPVCLPATESDLDSLLDGYLNTDDDAPRGVINMAREKRKVYIALKANNRGS